MTVPKPEKTLGIQSAEQFLESPVGVYRFPVDRSQSAKLGVPVIQFEPTFKRGKIIRLLVSYTQTPNHGEVYAIEGLKADSLWFIGAGSARYDPRVGWCSHHKTMYLAVPTFQSSFRVTTGSAIYAWMDGSK